MTTLIPPGYAQFVLRWSSPNFYTGGAATTLGYGAPGEPVIDADQFAVYIAESWETNLKASTDIETTLASVYWATENNSGEYGVNLPGTRNMTAAVPNTAFLISLATGFKGPRARGRLYWPSVLGSGDVGEDGLINGAHVTTLTGLFNDFFNDIDTVAGSQRQVVLQRETDEQKSEPLSPPPEVRSRVYQARAATQRRRLRR